MSLIKCRECEKEISNLAKFCPHCGFPLNNESKEEQILKMPEIPKDLSIGKQIVNWGGNAAFEGFFERSENVVQNIPSGKIKVLLHTHGIRITNTLYATLLEIHNSQIISIKYTTKAELINVDKSVIGRAVVGGLILGPLGAIIGGMSGIGSKNKLKDVAFLVINYWDIELNGAQTLLIQGEKTSIDLFLTKQISENNKNKSENRIAESNSGCMSILLIPIIITTLYYILH